MNNSTNSMCEIKNEFRKKSWFKMLFLSVLALFSAVYSYGQIPVTVSLTGGMTTTPALSASYATLNSALTALNSVYLINGNGTITLSLAAGNNETAPGQTGFVLGSSTLNSQLSSTKTISIIKATGTDDTLKAAVGISTPQQLSPDGIFSMRGVDWV